MEISVSISQLTLYVIVILSLVFGISTVMEFYKKTIRKDKAKVWEIRSIALVLCVGATYLLKIANLIQALLTPIGAKVWVDFVIYVATLYFLQLQMNMKILKKLLKSLIRNILISKGVDTEIVDTLLSKENN